LPSWRAFGASYSRASPPAFSTAFIKRACGLPRAIITSTVSGGMSASARSTGSSWAGFQDSTPSTSM
jgi:hypothetical protein